MAEEARTLVQTISFPTLSSVRCVHYYDIARLYIDNSPELAALSHILGWEHKRFCDWKSQALPTITRKKAPPEPPTQIDQAWVALSEPLSAATLACRKAVWAIQGYRNAEAPCRQLNDCNDMLEVVWRRSRARTARRLLPELDGFSNINSVQQIEENVKVDGR
jgi:hypothetical protein